MQTHVEAHLPNGVKLLEQVEADSFGDWPFTENEVWILTACNPESRPLSDEENEKRHQILGEQLEKLGLNYFYTRGFDPASGTEEEWSEDGYGVVGDVGEVVMSLAKDWEQNAVFIWTPTKWFIKGVLMKGESSSGWRYV